jgi:chloramphenicol-sensitive protein RarD
VSEAQKGILAVLASGLIWGFSPIYYKLLTHVPPIELLAHRVLWSVIFFVFLLGFQRRLGALRTAITTRRSVAILFLGACLIGVNWYIFIWSIQVEKATEASLGYFIFPLVVVTMGWIGFGERLSWLQNITIALTAAAVILMTVSKGLFPWIALVIAFSFSLYGYVKKTILTGPVVSVTAEVLLLLPLAVTVLYFVHRGGAGSFGKAEFDTLLLMVSGPLTATPLIFFSYAAKRISMATLGLANYLNPTIQFFCAIVIFNEPINSVQFFSFAMIWLALALYSLEGFRKEGGLQ